MPRRYDDRPLANDPGMTDKPLATHSPFGQSIMRELRDAGVPFKSSAEKRTITFESLMAFLVGVRRLSDKAPDARLEIFDESVGGHSLMSLIYPVRSGTETYFLRLAGDPVKHVLAPKAGLMRVEPLVREPGKRRMGYAHFDAKPPINASAVNRVLHGLPAELSSGGDTAKA